MLRFCVFVFFHVFLMILCLFLARHGSAVVRPWFGRGSAAVRRGSVVVRPRFGRGSAVLLPWFGRGLAVVCRTLTFSHAKYGFCAKFFILL